MLNLSTHVEYLEIILCLLSTVLTLNRVRKNTNILIEYISSSDSRGSRTLSTRRSSSPSVFVLVAKDFEHPKDEGISGTHKTKEQTRWQGKARGGKGVEAAFSHPQSMLTRMLGFLTPEVAKEVDRSRQGGRRLTSVRHLAHPAGGGRAVIRLLRWEDLMAS